MHPKPINNFLPRSILSPLHEPILDPRDGHGARSKRDLMILSQWKAARKGDDEALVDLVKQIVRENMVKLKAARGKCHGVLLNVGPYKMRSLIPAMTRLGMITAETVAVPPEPDGHATADKRQKIRLEPWFAEYAFERPGVDPEGVQRVCDWLAAGGIQRPHRMGPQD